MSVDGLIDWRNANKTQEFQRGGRQIYYIPNIYSQNINFDSKQKKKKTPNCC